MASNDPIRHIVVLMMENHSFDELLGWMKSLYPGLEGADPSSPRSNADWPDVSTKVVQAATSAYAIVVDPYHEHIDSLQQIANNCGGFVANFAQHYPSSTPSQRAQIMGYYPEGSLPVLHALAGNYMVCDHWFSSLPGPTWPNRFFVQTGTSQGHVKMPSGHYIKNEYFYDQNTIYNELDDNNHRNWSIYHHGTPHCLLLARLWDKPEHFHRMEQFFADAAGSEETFPEYAFIEPSYGGTDENDQHPPTDIQRGEYLIAQVYNALRKNDALWSTTLFVLLYDEHGGFYDHVFPPKTIAPDSDLKEYSFDQYGVRVPAILISPWVRRGYLSTIFDHTSLLRFLIDKWGLRPDRLGRRVEQASTFAPIVGELSAPRLDTLAPFDLSKLVPPPLTIPTGINDHQSALASFGHFLEQKMAHVEELAAVGYRALKSLDGPLAELDVAKDRFLLFLHHGQKGRLDPN